MTTPPNDLRRLASGSAASSVTAPPSRWKTRVFVPGVIVATVLALLLFASARSLLPATPVEVVPVVVKAVSGDGGAGAGGVTVQAPGWLEPDPHPYYVAALADGVVTEVLVLAGDRVERGQVVARLVEDDARLSLQRAEASLAQRQAQSRSAQAELTAARLQLEHLVEPRRALAVADAAVAEARAEIAKADADVAVAQARLAETRDEHDRKAKLVDTGAVPAAAVARLLLRVEAQQAEVAAIEARRGSFEAKLAQAEAERRAAATNVDLLIEEERAVALARALVETAEASVALAAAIRDEAALRLDRMSIRSPFAGVVMRRLASPGSRLVRGSAEHAGHVVHLYDPTRLQVRVDVPLAEAARVGVGQRAEITVEVLPDRVFTGSVTRVVHEADIQKNTVEVKVAINEPGDVLKPEMLARVRFLGAGAPARGSARHRVFAPDRLIAGRDGGDAAAWVVSSLVNERGTVERRPIVAGARRIDGWVEIESGLRVGDLLVADPAHGLRAGDRVRVIREAAPQVPDTSSAEGG